MKAVRALLAGLSLVLRAPVLLASVVVVMMLAAAPFGVVLNGRLQASLDSQPPISLDSGEIDPEWWMEFRAHARGLESTFTPAIVGFAAPLSNLSAVLDRTPQSLALAGPVALAAVVWAFLWGGLLARFLAGHGRGPRAFWASGVRHFPRFAAIALVAAAVAGLLYLTVHPLLFGPVYDALAAMASSERAAFFWRVALYAVFGSGLAAVSLVADYARVSLAAAEAGTVGQALAASRRFIAANVGSVATLYLLSGALFALLLTAYGVAEIYGGTRVGGWRGVAAGQAFVIGRIAIRLVSIAAEASLWQGAQKGRRG
jgi:hypothetical protein